MESWLLLSVKMLWLFAYGFFVPRVAFALVTLLGVIRQPRAREIARLLLREGYVDT